MSRPYVYLTLTFFMVLLSSMHPFGTPQDAETKSENPEEFAKDFIVRAK
jgi:predicted cobalt transporter CbtA